MKTLLLFAVILYGSFEQSIGQLQAGQTHYQCPPCGCSHDHKLLTGPGLCPSCEMPLVVVQSGLLRKIDRAAAPLLSDSEFNSLYYVKLIYPSIILALVVGLALFRKLVLNRGNVFLTIFLIALGLYAFKYQLTGVSYGWFFDLNIQFIPISFILALGPSIYFYTQSAIDRNFKFKKSMIWQFVPAILFFFIYMATYFSESIRGMVLVTPFESSISHVEQLGAVIGSFVYSFLAFRVLKSRRHLNGSWEYRTESVQWLKILLSGLIILMVVWAVMLVLNALIYNWSVTTITTYPLWIVFSIYIYCISYYIIFKSQDFNLPGFAVEPRETDRGLTSDQIEQYTSKLKYLLGEQKVYMDPALSLQSLSDMLEINPKKLSIVFKKGLEMNFFDVVNSYRIEEVKKQLLNSSNKHLTNVAIAYNAGFQSKSSFNAIFKKYVQMTPKEFKQQEMKILSDTSYPMPSN